MKQTLRHQKNLKAIIEKNMPEMAELFAIVEEGNLERQRQSDEKKREKRIYLENSRSFTLYIQYNKKQKNGLYYEEIQLEGLENGLMILECYRKIGHNLNLRLLNLRVNDENETRVHRYNFKY
jgi:hypothetical protein